MAAVKQASLVFRDSEDNKATMRFEGSALSSRQNVMDFLSALIPYTTCVRQRAIYRDFFVYAYATPASGHVDTKAIINAVDSDGKTHSWSLPGFNKTPTKTKNGYRVSDSDLEAILTIIETYTGLTLTPLESPVVIKQ